MPSRKYLYVQPVIAGAMPDIGIENCYANPREVGADRLVSAVSAVRKYGKPLIIVDIGTATALTPSTRTARIRAARFSPGLKVAMEALFLKALAAARWTLSGRRMPSARPLCSPYGRCGARLCRRALTALSRISEGAGRQGESRRYRRHGMLAECDLIDDVDPNLTLGLRHLREQPRSVETQSWI